MTTAVSNYKITDYTFLATDLAIMNDRLSGNNEHEALDMRKEMAASIMEMYTNNGSTISEAEALAMVDKQYSCVAGESLVDTIKETTKSADSFWNYVPIVNLFIDDTSAEDLYKYMEGEEANTKDLEKNGFAKVLSSTAAGAGAGAGVGACFAGVGAIPGAIVGGIIGLVTGIVDCFAQKEYYKILNNPHKSEDYFFKDTFFITINKTLQNIA